MFSQRQQIGSIAVILAVLVGTVLSSSGDRDSFFLNCLHKCTFSECSRPERQATLPLYLRLLQWSCRDNCKYTCMHDITQASLASGGHVQQFYGKWPFKRVLGVQEPASVIFSILNGVMHWRGYRMLRHNIPRRFPLRRLYLINSLLGLNVWIWSSIFHTRDTALTEKMDYFSAILAILFGAYVAAVRVFRLDQHYRENLIVATLAAGFYISHVTYLSLWPFDYGYNMAAGVTIGLLSNAVWGLWILRHWRQRPYAWKMATVIILIMAAMSLELFDFPPWKWAIDAHALWHAATIPLIPLLYSFMDDDIRWENRIGKGKHAMH
ncbi:Per1-like-domain-containing protein [Phlyctochytrium arcticum]|nr:Per1-like-domain-containing protein [Phlyctochytrium arcticum]